MLEARLRKNLDIPLLVAPLLVALIGIVAIFSATHSIQGHEYRKQLLWLPIGLAGMVAAMRVDYQRVLKWTPWLYCGNLVVLALVLVVAPETKGSQRWIPLGSFHLQPSEFAKLVMIVCLSAFLSARLDTIKSFGTVLVSLFYILPPVLLIFKQPDLGTALVIMCIWLGVTFMAGARVGALLAIVCAAGLLFFAMWHCNIIKPYQKARLAAFVDPGKDPKGTGYQVRESRIAVGSGELWGKGPLHGTQAQGRFIPENQTDFVFTVVGEEGGFVLSALLIGLYGIILFRGALIVMAARDMQARLLAAGILSMYAFHIVVNIGMTIGIMPVAGVPLPLVSYGGSNLILNLAVVGMLLNIGAHRESLVF